MKSVDGLVEEFVACASNALFDIIAALSKHVHEHHRTWQPERETRADGAPGKPVREVTHSARTPETTSARTPESTAGVGQRAHEAGGTGE